MTRECSTTRAVAVWLLVGLAGAAVTVPAAGALRTAESGRHDFAALLGGVAAVVALAATAWLWWCTTLVVVGALRGRPSRPRGCPEAWRRILLTGCGLGLAGVLAAPADAADRPAERTPAALDVRHVAALPLPDRAAGADLRAPVAPPRPAEVVVRPGDTLWALAAARLPAGASDAAIASYAARLHLRNLAVVGEDPDLIRPGQRLVLPPTLPKIRPTSLGKDHR